MYLRISPIVVLIGLMLAPVSLGQDVSGNSSGDSVSSSEIGNDTAEVNPAESPEDYVVTLHFYLIEEKIPEIVMDRLNNSLVEDLITVSDIISLSGLDRYDLDAARKLLSKYNLTTQEFFSVNSLEEWLYFVDASFYTFYEYLRSRAPINTETFEALGIEGRSLAYVLMFDPVDTFNVLRNGSYTDANIDAALATISLSRNQFFQIVRDFFVQEMVKMHPVLFWGKLRLKRREFLGLWEALELTPADVYAVKKFKKIFDDILDGLNNNMISIGIITDSERLLLHRKIYQNFCDDFASGLIRIEVVTASGENFRIVKYDQHLTINLIQLELDQSTENYAPLTITKDKSNLKNCLYFTTNGEPFQLISEELEISEKTKIATTTAKKSNVTVFNLGSPLVCDYNLHGLAASENETHIIFDRYYEDSFIDDNSPIDSGCNTITRIVINLVPVALIIYIFQS